MLSKSDIKKLAAEKWASSGLTAKDAQRLKLSWLTGAESQALHPSFQAAGALHIPYFHANGKQSKFFRLRYLEPLSGFAGALKKPQRYAQTPGTLNEVYLPPLLEATWEDVLADVEVQLYITEGELKAACACARGLPTIGLGGVDVWRSQKRKMPMLPQLEEASWKGRKVVIVFDSDAATNTDVVRAQRQLANALLERGALPVVAALPATAHGKKQGLDDFLVMHSVEELEAIVDDAAPLEEAQALWSMSEKVVYVRNPGLIIDRAKDYVMSPSAFVQHAYAEHSHVTYVGEKPKRVSTSKKWIEWRERFTAEKLTYAPGKERLIDGAWNRWRGWGVQPRRGTVDQWQRMLDFVFKGEPPEVRQWFERWCAYPLQYPGTKLFTSVVVWGVVQGTGKSLMGYTLRDIYGSNAVEIKNHQLMGGFNEWAENKQFVIGDEVTGSDKRVDADRLKGLITQEEMTINAKYVPTYVVPDCINYYFNSNHPDAFFLDDTDRRFFIHEVVGQPASPEFYRDYDKWRRGDGPAFLFDHLLRLPLGDFDPRHPALNTRAKEQMVHSSKSELGAWVRAMLDEPVTHLRPLGEHAAKHAELVTSSQLLRCYDPEGAGRVTANGIGRELARCGVRQLPITRTSIGTQRLYAVRSAEKWWKAASKEAASHWDKLFGVGSTKF